MRKSKNKIFVWLYMGVLCCVIAVGVAICIGLSGAGIEDLATEKADASSVFQIELIEDEQVPLSDSIEK